MRLIAALLILAWVGGAWANPSKTPPNCEKELIPKGVDPNAVLVAKLFDLQGKLDERLYPDNDPFVQAMTLDESQNIFELLAANDARNGRSIVGEIRVLLNSKQLKSFAEIKPLLDKLLQFSEGKLSERSASKVDLYRANVAIDMILPELLKLLPQAIAQELIHKEDGTPDKTQEEKQKAKQQPAMDEEVPPEFPDQDESNYDPHTKDSEQGKQPATKTFTAVEWSEPGVDFFWNVRWNSISRQGPDRFKVMSLPMDRKKVVGKYRPTKVTGTFFCQGKQDFALLIRPGYEPVQPDPATGASIYVTAGGQYRMKNPRKLDKIVIGLMPENDELNPVQIDFLKRPLGINENEWPHQIQSELFPLLTGGGLNAVRKVESYFVNKFLYSVGPRQETDPIEALKAGSFQCDMATLIGIAFIRDYLKLPARAIGGHRGKSSKSDPNVSQVVLPGDKHAEIEVYIDGKWHHFDFTPKRKDKKSKDEGKPDDEHDEIAKDVDEEFEVPDNEQSDVSPSKTSEKKKDRKAKISEDSENRIRENAKPAQPGQDDSISEEIQRDLEKALELGSLTLKKERIDGRLVTRARMTLLHDILDPSYDTSIGLQKLQRLKLDLRDEAELRAWALQTEIALTGRQRPVADALLSLAGSIRKADLTASFKIIVKLEDRLSLYVKTCDAKEQALLTPLLNDLRRIKSDLSKLSTEGRLAVGRAEKFFTGLPGHTRRLVEQEYKLSVIGDNLETKALSSDLKKGKKKDYNLIRILYPLTDFIMDSIPTPAHRMVKTPMDSLRPRGRDTLMMDDMYDSRDGVLLNPHASVWKNINDGTAFVKKRLRTARVPSPTGITQPKRVTIVNYDTSGSMEGKPGDFQAGLISAFVDRALSDISPTGRHNHVANLLGFDTDVHTNIAVKSSADAYDVIRNHRKKLQNTSGGTDIMKALEQSFAVIFDAQKRNNGEPLASANILLMSDGGSAVDLRRLRELMSLVDQRTPVKFMFVAINGTNPDLIQLTQDVKKAGAKESYYYEMTAQTINETLAESERPPEPDVRRELYTDKKPDALPQGIEGRLTVLASQIETAIKTMQIANQPRGVKSWLAEVERVETRPQNPKHTPLTGELSGYRSYMFQSKALRSRHEAFLVVEDIMKNWQMLMGKPFSTMMVDERESLKHMLREAALHTTRGDK